MRRTCSHDCEERVDTHFKVISKYSMCRADVMGRHGGMQQSPCIPASRCLEGPSHPCCADGKRVAVPTAPHLVSDILRTLSMKGKGAKGGGGKGGGYGGGGGGKGGGGKGPRYIACESPIQVPVPDRYVTPRFIIMTLFGLCCILAICCVSCPWFVAVRCVSFVLPSNGPCPAAHPFLPLH